MIDSADRGTSGGELSGLAAGRGTEVDDMAARHRSEQARGQGCGCILHPPLACRKARQIDDTAATYATKGTGRKYSRGKRFGTVNRGTDIERGLRQMAGRDGPGDILTIGRGPGLPKPVRRVQPRRILGLSPGLAFAPKSAQNCVNYFLVTTGTLLGKAHSGVNSGVRWRVEKKKLCGAEPQD